MVEPSPPYMGKKKETEHGVRAPPRGMGEMLFIVHSVQRCASRLPFVPL